MSLNDSRVSVWEKHAINVLGKEVDAAVRRALEAKLDDRVLIDRALAVWEKPQKDGLYNNMKGWTYASFRRSSLNYNTGHALNFEDLDDRGQMALTLFEMVDELGRFSSNSIPNTKLVDRHMFADNADELIEMMSALGGLSKEDS